MGVQEVRSVRVGQVDVPMAVALDWIREYTDPDNAAGEHPYAFPAYDCFDGGTDEPDRLTDGDLLAPGLLNVPVKIRSFYGLQRLRPRLEGGLKHPVLDRPLADVDDLSQLEAAVRDLYAVLDSPTERPWGVNATTLSKVLHRKRPLSVVLHDRWVRACYVGDHGPVPRAKERTWAEYMVLVTDVIRQDITRQREAFALLANAVRGPVVLSDIRILDIVAWRSQGRSALQASAVPDEPDLG